MFYCTLFDKSYSKCPVSVRGPSFDVSCLVLFCVDLVIPTSEGESVVFEYYSEKAFIICIQMSGFAEIYPSTSKKRTKDSLYSPSCPTDGAKVLLHRTKLKTIVNINNNMSCRQRREIDRVGFGSFARMNVTQIESKLVTMLIKNYDRGSRIINVGGVSISLSSEVVEKSFGLSREGMTIPKKPQEGYRLYQNLFSDGQGKVIGYNNLVDMVKECKTSGTEFVVPYLMILFATVLFPRSKDTPIDFEYLDYLVDLKAVHEYNWTEIILKKLDSGVRGVQCTGNKYITGCILIMQVVFLGYVTTAFPTVGKQLQSGPPFLEQWTQAEMTRAMFVFKQMGGYDETFKWKRTSQLSDGMKIDEIPSKSNVPEKSKTIADVTDKLIDQLTLVSQGVAGILSLLKDNQYRLVAVREDDNEVGNEKPKTGIDEREEHLAGKEKMPTPNTSSKPFDDLKPNKLDFDDCLEEKCTTGTSYNTAKDAFELFKEITDMDEEACNYVFNENADVTKTLMNYDGWLMTRGEMLSAKYPRWFMNSVIDFAAIHVSLSMNTDDSKKRHWVLPALFSAMALSSHDDSVIQATCFQNKLFNGRADECYSIILPMSDSDIHWFICIVDIRNTVIRLCDTLRSVNTNARRMEQAQKVIARLEQIVSKWDGDGFVVKNIATQYHWDIDSLIPRQLNGYDCGLYVCLQMFCRSIPSINIVWRPLTEEDSKEARRRLAVTLYKTKHNQITRGGMFVFFCKQKNGFCEISCGQSYDSSEITFEALSDLLEYAGSPTFKDDVPVYFGREPSPNSSFEIPITTTEELRKYISSYISNGRFGVDIEIGWVNPVGDYGTPLPHQSFTS